VVSVSEKRWQASGPATGITQRLEACRGGAKVSKKALASLDRLTVVLKTVPLAGMEICLQLGRCPTRIINIIRRGDDFGW
jgi:hypothetical protein